MNGKHQRELSLSRSNLLGLNISLRFICTERNRNISWMLVVYSSIFLLVLWSFLLSLSLPLPIGVNRPLRFIYTEPKWTWKQSFSLIFLHCSMLTWSWISWTYLEAMSLSLLFQYKRNAKLIQGSHQSGKSGNSGKILKTFSSQGNQGKTGIFQPKSGKKISNQGTFFPNHF